MRPRKRRSKKDWHFDDYDASDYTLDSDSSVGPSQALVPRNERPERPGRRRVSSRNQSLNLCPREAAVQIKITGNISISVVGQNGQTRELFRFVDINSAVI